MKALLVAALLPLIVGAVPRHDDPLWLMFFMKGGAKGPDAEAEQKALMDGHFANMKKQAALGRLFTAGPLRDPTQQRRGITVVAAHDRKAVDPLFAQDPFVKADIMRVDAGTWKVKADAFQTAIDPSNIAEHRLLLFKRGKGMSPETKAMRAAHEASMKTLLKGTPILWGPVDGFQGILEAMIVASTDDAAIEAALAKDPFVSKALLEVESLPLWMSKGVLKD